MKIFRTLTENASSVSILIIFILFLCAYVREREVYEMREDHEIASVFVNIFSQSLSLSFLFFVKLSSHLVDESQHFYSFKSGLIIQLSCSKAIIKYSICQLKHRMSYILISPLFQTKMTKKGNCCQKNYYYCYTIFFFFFFTPQLCLITYKLKLIALRKSISIERM